MKFGLGLRHHSSLSGSLFETKQHIAIEVWVWCIDDGVLFSPNLIEFGPLPLRSRVWKYAPPLNKLLNLQ